MTELIYHNKSGTYFPQEIGCLSLISIGTRTKYKLVVYGIGLYSSNPDKYPQYFGEETFDNGNEKMFLLNFYRKVTNEKIYNAFIEQLEKRVILDNFADDIIDFQDIFSSVPVINYKDMLRFHFTTNGLKIYYKKDGESERELGVINNERLIRNIYNIYLDDNSVTKDLRTKFA
jgi:hypothetical protein